MPRCTYGVSCSTTPVGPTVPTVTPSATTSPRRTPIVPRWVSVTEYPSAVSIVSDRPLVGTVPANETVPDAGTATGPAATPPMTTPRCRPAAYGSAPRSNRWSTGPSTGHVQAAASLASASAATAITTRTARILLLLLPALPTKRP